MKIFFGFYDLGRAFAVAYKWRGRGRILLKVRLPKLWDRFLEWRYQRKLRRQMLEEYDLKIHIGE